MNAEREDFKFIQKQFWILVALLTASVALNFFGLWVVTKMAERPIIIVQEPPKSTF